MKTLALALLLGSVLAAQTEPAPAPAPVVSNVVNVGVAPLAPPDMDTPYASPRDAARHWLQASLAGLRDRHDLHAAMRGFAQAYLLDRTYAPAVFDLGIVVAIAEKWDDAAGALAEAARLDPTGLGAAAKPQLERATLLATLERTPEGRRQRRYDEALLALLPALPRLAPGEAFSVLAQLGRIDPKRWEAPAMLAALGGNAGVYVSAAKFLELAAASATDAKVRARLHAAKAAAAREVEYASARVLGENASEQGKYADAAQFYESAWSTIPARSTNAMDAASAHLLNDDTAKAATLLVRLRSQSDDKLAGLAAAMLKELEQIEPAAKANTNDTGEFFRDKGSEQAPRLAEMIPPVNGAALEIYGRPLPKLVDDTETVVLLSALAADQAAPASVPALPQPQIAGDHPWAELAPLLRKAVTDPATSTARPMQAADLAHDAVARRLLQVSSMPSAAKVFINAAPDAICETPCSVQVLKGNYTVRLTLPGYEEAQENVTVGETDKEVLVPLAPVRGIVLVEAPPQAAITVNGQPVANAPAELALVPGLHRIAVDSGGSKQERMIMVKPGARLRLQFK